MKRRTLLASGIAAATLAAPALRAQSTTEVKVLYSIPDLFKTLHEQIAAEFMKANPQYKITFLAPQPAYEEIAQATLRAAVTNTLPDVAYQGLNRQRIFFDRGLAQPLDALIAADPDFKTFGHSPGLLDVGRFGSKQLGIGFSVSTPIIYYNADLVTKAGGDPAALPADWDGIFALARKIKALGGATQGFHFDWDITGNWMWQALVFSHGGAMMSEDEKTVAFDKEPGKKSIELLGRMVKDAGMPDLTPEASRAAFFAGKLFGRHKLARVLSPGKTWEGFVIGTVVCVLVAFFALYEDRDTFLSIWEAIVLGTVIALASTVGDLFESAVKRDMQVKDSGRLLGGHGGVLDRIDSLLFASVAGYYTIVALH